MSDDQTADASEAYIGDTALEQAADRFEVDERTIADALVVLHAALIGRHSEFESSEDYATVDGTRAYRVPESAWDDLIGEFDFEDDVAAAVMFAHTEQAKLLFADAVGVDERFGDHEYGVIVGIDTAEEF